MDNKVFKALESVKLGEASVSDSPIPIKEKHIENLKEMNLYHKELFLNSEDENVERFMRLAEERFATIGNDIKRGWYVYDEQTGKFVNDSSKPRNFYFVEVCNEIEFDCYKYKIEHKDEKSFAEEIKTREKWAIKSKTDRLANAVLRRAFDHLNKGSNIADYFDKADKPDIKYFNCRNWTLEIDIKTGKINKLPHSPEYKITFCADVDFDEKAKCPLWENCIRKYVLNDEATALYLQALLGLSLIGVNKDQIFVIMSGSGSNGKSTVLKHMQALMGDYGLKSRNDVFTKGNSKVDDNVIWAMKGKRFVYCSEGDKKAVLDSGRIKDITGGEEEACRPIYSEQVNYKPEFIPIFATNNLPMIYDNGNSIERRARVISFGYTIKENERDPLVDSNLEKEYSGILNWLIAGLKLWFKNGCSLEPLTSKKIRNDSKQYLFSNDYILQFIKEELEADKESRVSDHDIYNRYACWCLNSGIKSVRKQELIKRIRNHFYDSNYKKLPDGNFEEIKHPLLHGYPTVKGFRLKWHETK